MAPDERVVALDGLRGYAALAVVLNHAMIVYPWLRSARGAGGSLDHPGAGWWVLTYTPAHLFWLGVESVMTFFVLSGVALTLRARQRGAPTWRRYYPQRMVRLYLPVWAAMVWAVLVFVLVTRHGDGAYVDTLDARLHSVAIVRDVLLTTGATNFNGPMWSLRWEVAFSLLLPAYLVLLRWLQDRVALAVVTVFVVSGIGCTVLQGSVLGEALFYLPMFALGCLIAAHWDRLAALARRIEGSPHARVVWAAWLAVTLAGLTTTWMVLALDPARGVVQLSQLVALAAAAGLVVHAAFNPALRRLLERPGSQWLGTVSFSLYLTHAPVLVALEALLPDSARPLVLLVGLPLALVVAVVFHRWVERPSHRLAQRIGRRRTASPHAPAVAG